MNMTESINANDSQATIGQARNAIEHDFATANVTIAYRKAELLHSLDAILSIFAVLCLIPVAIVAWTFALRYAF